MLGFAGVSAIEASAAPAGFVLLPPPPPPPQAVRPTITSKPDASKFKNAFFIVLPPFNRLDLIRFIVPNEMQISAISALFFYGIFVTTTYFPFCTGYLPDFTQDALELVKIGKGLLFLVGDDLHKAHEVLRIADVSSVNPNYVALHRSELL
jgi:hypothetical protein